MGAESLYLPAYLGERIGLERRIFSVAREWHNWSSRVWPAAGTFFRPALALAVLVLLILPVLHLMWPAQESIALSALKTHKKIVEGDISFAEAGSEKEIKERVSRSVGGRFVPMGHDFSLANLQPIRGLVQEGGGRKVLVTIYGGKESLLSCYTFLGTEKEDVPADAALFLDPEKGIHLYAFSRGPINGVMQHEGQASCLLVSEMPMTDLLALARSRA